MDVLLDIYYKFKKIEKIGTPIFIRKESKKHDNKKI
jgi:hypothetical protein